MIGRNSPKVQNSPRVHLFLVSPAHSKRPPIKRRLARFFRPGEHHGMDYPVKVVPQLYPSTSKHVRCGGSFATMPGRCPCLVRLPHQARTPIQPEHQDCPRSGNKRRRNTRASRCQTSKSWQLVAEVAAKSTGECEHCRRPDLWLPRLPLTIERHAAKRQSATSSATAATPP